MRDLLSSMPRIAQRNVRGSVGNAARAAARLYRWNAERTVLTRTLHGGRHEPGDLVRLSRHESIELLRSRRVGRFAHLDRGHVPSVVPVNYVMTGDDTVLFR